MPQLAPLLLALAPLAPSTDGPRDAAPRGDGAPVCGLGREFHAGRRAALRARLEEGWALFRGLPKPRDASAFHQDKQFWYLTGVESPEAALLMDAATGREILFLPAPDPSAERWEGELWDSGDAWVAELTGFGEVRPSESLLDVLDELLDEGDRLWTSSHPELALMGTSDYARRSDERQSSDPLDGRPTRPAAMNERLAERLGVRVADCAPHLLELRWRKTPEEVAAMRRAGRAGALAMVEGVRATRPGAGEWEIEALMSYLHMRAGASGPAYHAIVGSGANSCVLHYSANDRAMRAEDVLLVDYGCEVDHYTTDITRTWPVGGRFGERAADMYDAVLAAQAAGIAAVRPGATLAEVDRAARAVLQERGYGHLVLHGTSHWIGMEVHDPGPRRGGHSVRLEPGAAFTVEPGIYDPESGVGIRIEDVVVVTAEGCEVLTSDVPKARAEVEALVGTRELPGRAAGR